MTWRELSAERLNQFKRPVVIDVRSPCEHEAEHIPNSINLPLLSDSERAEVGIIYKNDGEIVARRHALRIISPKIPTIVDQIVSVQESGRALVVHCWRGGLRSEAVASFLAIVGIDCWRLTGGYKAWRRQVIEDLEDKNHHFLPVVLHGQTGTGKTNILAELAKRAQSVLDLEALANHRGSVFGGMGMGQQPTQKNFEAQLWLKLRQFRDEPVFIEAESRKIGRIAMPDMILNRIASGRRILVTGTLDARARRIVNDYAAGFDDGVLEVVLKALNALKERLGTKRLDEIKSMLVERNLEGAVRDLLVYYYDPLYDRDIVKNEPYDLVVNGDDPAQAAAMIGDWAAASLGQLTVHNWALT